jgi:hypothetical protein
MSVALSPSDASRQTHRGIVRATIYNCSTSHYNRGTQALGYWLKDQGYEVKLKKSEPDLFDLAAELFCFSAIFTWDLPLLANWVNRVRDFGEVWIGGPAPSINPEYVQQQTGIVPHIGPDFRFEQQPGHYKMGRTSRGCPFNCSFCIVAKIDGRKMVEYKNFNPAPVLLDDNILATSTAHQERVVEMLLSQNYPVVDFNSGFDPSLFDRATFTLFKKLPLKYWRLAFDEIKEERVVQETMRLLRENGIAKGKIRVYCLIGNESFEDCHYRAEKIIEWGGEPHVQPLIPLNTLEKRPVVQYDWTAQKLIDFSRYYNRWLWRKPERSFDWYRKDARRKTKIK